MADAAPPAAAEPSKAGVSRQPSRQRVFRKTSYDDHITVYMGKREFIDHGTHVDPIDAVILPSEDFEKLGMKMFAHIACILRYGNDDWDTLGVPYEKTLYAKSSQVYPLEKTTEKTTHFQRKMLRKLGARAFPVTMNLPTGLPSSVFLQAVGTEKPKKPEKACGISLQLIVNFAEKEEEPVNKKRMVRFVFRKLSFIPPPETPVQPSVSVNNKNLLGAPSKVDVKLDKDTYYPGETINVTVDITNFGRDIRKVRAQIEQGVDLKIDDGPKNWTSHCVIATVKSSDGCPIEKNKSHTLKLSLPIELPTVAGGSGPRLVAVDGWIRGEDLRLAASTRKTHTAKDHAIGLAVSYAVAIKCKRLGGNINASVPFVLSGAPPKAASSSSSRTEAAAAAAAALLANAPASSTSGHAPEMIEIPVVLKTDPAADGRRQSMRLGDEPEDSDDDLIDFGDSEEEGLSKEFSEFVKERARVSVVGPPPQLS